MTASRSTVRRSDSAVAALSAGDEAFFRTTASLFSSSFLFGAGVLLGTYDEDDGPAPATPRPVEHRTTRTATTAVRA